MLEQVGHLGVPLGDGQPLFLQLLGPIPGRLVHQRRDRDLDPRLLRLGVDSRPFLRRHRPPPSVAPGALVGRIPDHAVDLGLVPPHAGLGRRDSLVGQPPGDGGDTQPFVDVQPEDALHDLGLDLHYLWLATLSDPVAVGEAAGWYTALLGGPSLAHSRSLTEVVELDLPDGCHEAEGLQVDGVHDGLEPDLVGLHDLHEDGGGVHPPAQPVGLPADDGVEASVSCVGEHPLELRALLGPAPANLLIARDDGQSRALAVGLHLADLLGDGGLVLLGLALIRDAGIDRRPVGFYLLSRISLHDSLLLSLSAEMKKTRLQRGAGLRVVQSIRITCSRRWRHGPGCRKHRRATFCLGA